MGLGLELDNDKDFLQRAVELPCDGWVAWAGYFYCVFWGNNKSYRVAATRPRILELPAAIALSIFHQILRRAGKLETIGYSVCT